MDTENQTIYVINMSTEEIASNLFLINISEDRAQQLSDLIKRIFFNIKLFFY